MLCGPLHRSPASAAALHPPGVYPRHFLGVGRCCPALEGVSVDPLAPPGRRGVGDGVAAGPVARWRAGRAASPAVLPWARPPCQPFPFQVPRLRLGFHFGAQPAGPLAAAGIPEHLVQGLQLRGWAGFAEGLWGLERELLQAAGLLPPDGDRALRQLLRPRRLLLLAGRGGRLE